MLKDCFVLGNQGCSSKTPTLDSDLSSGVDSAMFVLSHTLVHPRILQSQIADLQTSPIHLNSVLGGQRGNVT